jgi:hypothetical protein
MGQHLIVLEESAEKEKGRVENGRTHNDANETTQRSASSCDSGTCTLTQNMRVERERCEASSANLAGSLRERSGSAREDDQHRQNKTGRENTHCSSTLTRREQRSLCAVEPPLALHTDPTLRLIPLVRLDDLDEDQ